MRPDIEWFNANPGFRKWRGRNVKLWNLFRRKGLAWGVGLGQIDGTHLLYVGQRLDQGAPQTQVCVLWTWVTQHHA